MAYWTIQELMNYVYTETNRPDLVQETQSAVLASIMKMHGLDFFPRDVQSGLIVFDTTAYIQELDVSSIPRFRAFKAIRKWDPSFAQYQQNPTLLPPLQNNSIGLPYNEQLALGFIRILDVDDVLDDYNTEKVDVGYLAGTTFYIKSSTSFQQAFCHWYAYPQMDFANNFANFNSWIAENHPYAIIYDAASSILQKIGQTDAARKYDSPQGGLVADQINNLRISATTLLGR